MRKQLTLVAMLLMITATVLLAHDLFLKLDSYFVPPSSAVRVAVLNGTFSSSEGAVKADQRRHDVAQRADRGARDLCHWRFTQPPPDRALG